MRIIRVIRIIRVFKVVRIIGLSSVLNGKRGYEVITDIEIVRVIA